jgi:hypothetical protein
MLLAIDYIELYAPPVTTRTTTTNDSISSIENEELQIHVDITYNHNDQYLVIRVKNSNFGIKDAGFTEQRLYSIFGDLEVLCIPYVLATKYQSYFDNIVWDEPFIISNGFGKQFEVRVVVDIAAGSNMPTYK